MKALPSASSRLKHSKAIRTADECAPKESGRQHAIDPRIGNVLIAGNGRHERNLLQRVESHLYVLGRQNRVGMRCTVGAATMQRRARKGSGAELSGVEQQRRVDSRIQFEDQRPFETENTHWNPQWLGER